VFRPAVAMLPLFTIGHLDVWSQKGRSRHGLIDNR
jgi:hypothetical protein